MCIISAAIEPKSKNIRAKGAKIINKPSISIFMGVIKKLACSPDVSDVS